MRFKKVYIEITNVCNFNCSFCFKSEREKKFMSPELFSATLFSIKPYTDYIYLHVLGEPLLHPQFPSFVSLAHDMGFKVNVTTNGSLLEMRSAELLSLPIRQFNISLHDAEENISSDKIEEYLTSVADFADLKSHESYFSYRLWNVGSDCSAFNNRCISFLSSRYGIVIPYDFTERNIKLAPHVFLQWGNRFSWPGEKSLSVERRRCYALQTHVAVLSDGMVVPCCLDAAPFMPLGNILNEDFGKIINSERAVRILEGFRHGLAVEPICKDCGFIIL